MDEMGHVSKYCRLVSKNAKGANDISLFQEQEVEPTGKSPFPPKAGVYCNWNTLILLERER